MQPVSDKSDAFEELVGRVQNCRACPRMCESVRVLSWANGNPNSPLMFVGEAPGRLGADRTAIPFHGDKAGDNFEKLLELAGVRRSEVFVTNAVLCNPRDRDGNNAPPTSREVEECANHLKAQIDLVQPALVMTLGSVALEATRFIERHDLNLKTHVRTHSDWYGRKILPLYHPGARAMIHRSFANQTADYYFVGETYRRLGKERRRANESRGSAGDWHLVKYILDRAGKINYFRLHKALYLIDLKCLSTTGKRATSFLYLRQKDGPYCVELGSRWYQRFDREIVVRKVQDKLIFESLDSGLFAAGTTNIKHEIVAIADEILQSIASLTDAELKTRAYLTGPMKEILRAEKAGSRTLNKPLLAA